VQRPRPRMSGPPCKAGPEKERSGKEHRPPFPAPPLRPDQSVRPPLYVIGEAVPPGSATGCPSQVHGWNQLRTARRTSAYVARSARLPVRAAGSNAITPRSLDQRPAWASIAPSGTAGRGANLHKQKACHTPRLDHARNALPPSLYITTRYLGAGGVRGAVPAVAGCAGLTMAGCHFDSRANTATPVLPASACPAPLHTRSRDQPGVRLHRRHRQRIQRRGHRLPPRHRARADRETPRSGAPSRGLVEDRPPASASTPARAPRGGGR